MAVLELISKIGLDLPVAARAVDLFRRRAARRFQDSDAPVAAYLRSEPYALAQVEGAEWKDADSLAKSLGLPGGFDPKRVAGAVHAFLWSKARQGHCFFPRPDTVYQVWRWLGGRDSERGKRERQLIDDIIERMVEEGKLCFESKPYGGCVKALMDKVYPDAPPGANRARQGVLYLPEIYWSEKRLARLLAGCALAFPDVRIDADRLVEAAQEIAAQTFGGLLNAEQEQAVRNVARYPATVLMGAAGTGKTTTVNVILRRFRARPRK